MTNFSDMVLRSNDPVLASGRVLRTGTGDWFEPPLASALRRRAKEGIRSAWRGAVRIDGVNFDKLGNIVEVDGWVAAYAKIKGIWLGDRVTVEQQETATGPWRRHHRYTAPPCGEPAGGWPRFGHPFGDQVLKFDPGELLHIGAAVAMTIFRPSEDQAVLVVAAVDLAAVEAQLRPELGESLCVLASMWTRQELDAVQGQLKRQYAEWNLYELGQSVGDDGQARVNARLTQVLPEVASWADSLPDGIVSLDPWLRRE